MRVCAAHGSLLRSIQQSVASKQASAVEVTQAYLQQLRSVEDQLQSFITISEEAALAQVRDTAGVQQCCTPARAAQQQACSVNAQSSWCCMPCLAGCCCGRCNCAWQSAAAGWRAHCCQGELMQQRPQQGPRACRAWPVCQQQQTARQPACDAPHPPGGAHARRLQDNLCTQGVATTAGSRVLEGYVPPFDATAIARLKAAGAVVIGKTNLDQFGMGSSTENSAFKVRACTSG